MKSLKLILPIMAFVFAIVGAFASNAFLDDAKGIQTGTLDCVTGTLQTPPTGTCSKLTSNNRCQVEIPAVEEGTEIVDAFTVVGCIEGEELYYPD